MSRASLKEVESFLNDVLRSVSKEREHEKIMNELQSIKKNVNKKDHKEHNKRTDVLKMIIINLLGYEIDFGLIEVIELLSSPKYESKRIGSLAFRMIYQNNEEAKILVTNTLQKDLQEINPVVVSDAIILASQISNNNLFENIGNQIISLAFGSTSNDIKKKALLCLMKFIRTSDFDNMNSINFNEIINKINVILGKEKDVSVLNAICLVLHELLLKKTIDKPSLCVISDKIVIIFKNLVTLLKLMKDPKFKQEYRDFSNPWLLVKMIRLVQCCIQKYNEQATESDEVILSIDKSQGEIKEDDSWIKSFNEICEEYLRLQYDRIGEELNRMRAGYTVDEKDILMMSCVVEIIRYVVNNENIELFDISMRFLIMLINNNTFNNFVCNPTQQIVDNNILLITLDLFVSIFSNVTLSNKAVSLEFDISTTLFNRCRELIESPQKEDSVKKQAIDLLFYSCNKETAKAIVNYLLGIINTAGSSNSLNGINLNEGLEDNIMFKICLLINKYLEGEEYIKSIVKFAESHCEYLNNEILNDVMIKISADDKMKAFVIHRIENIIQHSLSSNVVIYNMHFMSFICLVTGQFSQYLKNSLLVIKFFIGEMMFCNDQVRTKIISCLARIIKSNKDNIESVKSLCTVYTSNCNPELQQRVMELFVIILHLLMLSLKIFHSLQNQMNQFKIMMKKQLNKTNKKFNKIPCSNQQ